MIECFTGFDSAWTDSKKSPGAICSATFCDGRLIEFFPPKLSTFSHASTIINELSERADVTLVAIDQPTIVENETGSRLVESVARSVVCKFKSGVQPANRSKSAMFGAEAPIWKFIETTKLRQDPLEAAGRESGRYLIEVFPALALPTLVPEVCERRCNARYNPARRKTFALSDWQLVCRQIGRAAMSFSLDQASQILSEMEALNRPTKADQDKLDSIICLLLALHWRRGDLWKRVKIGDEHGYMCTPATDEIAAILHQAARKTDVGFSFV